jgi:ABC-type Mn2+/Zn2+ transport system ATPase subunit
MIKPLAGTISLGGSNGTKPRFGYVPQRDTIDYILPYSVLEVVMMGRYRHIGMFHAPNDGDRDVVVRSLSHVGVQDLRDLPFKDLSGGQKQRVLIARALATEPRILILDEPTNGMDLSSRTSILDLISTLHEEGQLTVIMVSHLLDDVANHVQQMAIVEHDQFQVGRVEEVLTAGNLSALYQMPVVVEDIGGSKFVLTGGRRGAS